MTKRNHIKQKTQAALIQELQKEIIVLNSALTKLKNDLKKVDMAIFECVQKTSIVPFGAVTDSVMNRVRSYSDHIGEEVFSIIASASPKTKGKVRR